MFAHCGGCDSAWRSKENCYRVGKWEERGGLGQPNRALEESVWVGRKHGGAWFEARSECC